MKPRQRKNGVVVSYRNSTSNHNVTFEPTFSPGVVSYRNSTSNHNTYSNCFTFLSVVSYRNSTSNHNIHLPISIWTELYLIEILHQTTTAEQLARVMSGCILSKFYIKPQPKDAGFRTHFRCILSKFYIKPQPSGLILIDKVLLTGCLPL